MNPIKKMSGLITKVTDLSPTAREYVIKPSELMPFTAGSFVNLFVEHSGEKIRRAFSMSSADTNPDEFAITIRLSPNGKLTPLLWAEDYVGREIELMGPLGLNTADKMTASKTFLFGFGVGAGVVKSLAENLGARDNLNSLTIVTGNRSTEEILHKDFFDSLSETNEKVSVKYVVSDNSQTIYPIGHIQDHLTEYDFSNSDVYMCGQGVACDALEKTISSTNPTNCNFFVEDFH
ncbi:hypothetical protein H6784_06005 [Candidatus Nomurabacteria bacterium]|nr:hypothetical protein [Candidatus Kaiserbacteria bacterium]MCB9811065.1 hypothetical protein [Candidatus Nomurabacteria bacterium]MCB9814925.1 hypothetical protein [Candidatus Nomurabacteria bacterium]